MSMTRRFLLGSAAFAGLLATGARAQDTPQLATIGADPDPLVLAALHAREKTSLDGTWKYVLDPYDVIRRKPNARRNVWQESLQQLDGPLIEYEWESSPELTVPGDWNTQLPELTWYDGPVYLRRLIEPPPAHLRTRRFLVFEAVNYRSKVWLNSEEIGAHEGGFTPFAIEVTDKLRPGANSLVVRADSRHDANSLPSVDFDWKNYGGITRSVWLVDTPATFIQDSFVRLDGVRIVADVRLNGPRAAGASVAISIPELDLRVRARTDGEGRARLEAPAPVGLALWSPQTPQLYDVTISTGSDRHTEAIGFRRIETRGREIFLNGAPIFLRGVAMHEETIGENASRTVSEAHAERLLQTARDLGCNFVRLAHYPHATHVARLADRLGLMVWAEIPVYWEDVTYGNDATLALARQMMSELILRDRNRASVVFWSVANETPQTPDRNHFLRAVIADARRLDSTRLITAALNKNVDVGGVRDGESRFSVEDELGRDLDVIAMNQYEGWYGRRTPAQIFDQVRFSTTYEKPLIMSEFGADALAGHHGDRRERWTEEHQAWIYEETLRCIDRDGFAGVCPWLLKDFRSPRRWHGRFQAMWNRKGVITDTGVRKQAFETLRGYYARKTGS
jgi:beta-glucuronidase